MHTWAGIVGKANVSIVYVNELLNIWRLLSKHLTKTNIRFPPTRFHTFIVEMFHLQELHLLDWSFVVDVNVTMSSMSTKVFVSCLCRNAEDQNESAITDYSLITYLLVHILVISMHALQILETLCLLRHWMHLRSPNSRNCQLAFQVLLGVFWWKLTRLSVSFPSIFVASLTSLNYVSSCQFV